MTEDDKAFSLEVDKYFPKLRLAEMKDWDHEGYCTDFVKQMWDKYRDHVPPGPDGSPTPPAATTWK
jgi:hypothetical protein